MLNWTFPTQTPLRVTVNLAILVCVLPFELGKGLQAGESGRWLTVDYRPLEEEELYIMS